MTKEQLRQRFIKLANSFTADEMSNPVTRESITNALVNIKKELTNGE